MRHNDEEIEGLPSEAEFVSMTPLDFRIEEGVKIEPYSVLFEVRKSFQDLIDEKKAKQAKLQTEIEALAAEASGAGLEVNAVKP